MSKTLAIIGARLNSSRLPGKHLLPLPADANGGSKPMISHLLARLSTCKKVDSIELATTADAYNAPLVNWAYENNVLCQPFEGDVNDLMGRLDVIIQRHQPDYIVYICGDCPLIAPDFIDHAIGSLSSTNMDAVKLSEDVSSIHEGMAIYSRAGWEKLFLASQCEMSREHVGYADRISPILNKLYIADSNDYSAIKHRISVDTEADYKFMSEVYQRWYKFKPCDTLVNLQWVIAELLRDTSLRKLNEHVNQKQPNKKYPKISVLCQANKIIGLGHLKRAVLASHSIKESLGIGVTLHIIGEPTPGLHWLPAGSRWHNTQQSAFAALLEDNADLWLLDYHPDFIDTQLLAQIMLKAKSENVKLIGIDRSQIGKEVLDAIFVPSFYYHGSSSKVDFGWANYLIKTIKSNCEVNKQVLILTGGADTLRFGNWLPILLSKVIPADFSIKWVQGPYAKAPITSNINSRSQSSRISVIISPDNVPKLIAESEVVISCYGVSLFEAILSGKLTVLLPTHDLCEPQELEALHKEECCYIIDKDGDIADKLAALFKPDNSVNRKKLTDKASELAQIPDGLNRLCMLIGSILEANNA